MDKNMKKVNILLTGDIHLGKGYQKEDPDVAKRYCDARIEAFRNTVLAANRAKCQVYVIAGDLFDRLSGITAGLMKQAASILSEFEGETILILPGNHDYYDPDMNPFWEKFEEYTPSNVSILKKEEPVEAAGIVFYPCPCHERHAEGNALGWVKGLKDLDPEKMHIGIAHGAIEGLSFDREQKYFYMPRKELEECGMDAWLIGHTHTRTECSSVFWEMDNRYEGLAGKYGVKPPDGAENFCGSRMQDTVFNAGTPQPTDIADSSLGEVFVLECSGCGIYACAVQTSVIGFAREEVNVSLGDSLEEKLDFPYHAEDTTLRVRITGTASEQEYENRKEIYRKLQEKYLKFEVDDSGLRKEISLDMIAEAAPEESVLFSLMSSYKSHPDLLNLAYDLVKGR